MTIGIEGEILVYVLTASLAVSAGLVLGGPSSSTHQWMRLTSGLLIVMVVVVAGFALGLNAPWVGPIFALVCMLAGTLAATAAKRSDRALTPLERASPSSRIRRCSSSDRTSRST